MKILYVGPLSGTSGHRYQAIKRLCEQQPSASVSALDVDGFVGGGSRLSRYLLWRRLKGKPIDRLNAAVLAAAHGRTVDLVWFDKAQWIRQESLAQLNAWGVKSLHYSSDLPSEVRGDAGWDLFKQAASRYDFVVAPSEGHRDCYRELGVDRLLIMPFGYDPQSHFPPPGAWDDGQQPMDVSFIGSPYERRAEFVLSLALDHGLKVHVFGDRWKRRLSRSQRRCLHLQPGVYSDGYREAIWASKISLGFVTHTMRHDSARRWSEISACGGLLLAEATAAAGDWFDLEPGDAQQALTFDSVQDCAQKIRALLANPQQRRSIALRGCTRTCSTRSNDERIRALLAESVGWPA